MENLSNKLFQIDVDEMKNVIGGRESMSKGFEGGSPHNPQDGYDTAEKTPGTDANPLMWDEVKWFDMCSNPDDTHK